jgi:hypothetical protein
MLRQLVREGCQFHASASHYRARVGGFTPALNKWGGGKEHILCLVQQNSADLIRKTHTLIAWKSRSSAELVVPIPHTCRGRDTALPITYSTPLPVQRYGRILALFYPHILQSLENHHYAIYRYGKDIRSFPIPPHSPRTP